MIDKIETSSGTIEDIEVTALSLGDAAPFVRAVKIYDTSPDKVRGNRGFSAACRSPPQR